MKNKNIEKNEYVIASHKVAGFSSETNEGRASHKKVGKNFLRFGEVNYKR